MTKGLLRSSHSSTDWLIEYTKPRPEAWLATHATKVGGDCAPIAAVVFPPSQVETKAQPNPRHRSCS
jgi:hypothetical protein